jgi:hypothetical protein
VGDAGINGRIVWLEGVDWINVAEDRGKWWVVVTIVENLCFVKCRRG